MDFFMNPGLKVESGWVKIHRKIREHWIWEPNKTYSKFQAWTDIILQANHEGKKILLGNELIFINRGSFISSIRKLGDKWHWSRTKVIKFLKSLQSDSMLIVKSDTKKTVLTLVNYNTYQGVEIEKKPQKSHKKATEVTRKSLNKNEKNEKNEKKKDKNIDLSEFDLTIIDFEEMRKKIKEPLTDRAKKTLLKKLERMAPGNEKYKIELLEQSILNNWKSVFPLKEDYQNKTVQDSGIPLTTEEQIRERDKK